MNFYYTGFGSRMLNIWGKDTCDSTQTLLSQTWKFPEEIEEEKPKMLCAKNFIERLLFWRKPQTALRRKFFWQWQMLFIQYWFCCVSNTNMPDNRARYIATAIQVILLGAVTYYGVKWLVDVLDPTKKSRLAAQKQVSILQTKTKL